MKKNNIVIGITHGDINGISYEVIIKSLLDSRMMEFCVPIVYGSPKVAGYHRKTLNINNFSFNSINKAEEKNPKRPNIINCVDENIRVELGKSTQQAGESSLSALKTAVADLKDGKIDALVTAPFNKFNMQSDEFNFPGHTEYLQEQFEADDSLMFMVSDKLKVGVVIGHSSIADLPKLITQEKVLRKIRIMNDSLKKDFGIRKPKIAVLGLNPHAGENGVLGTEEQEKIIPAIEKAKEKNMTIFGPYPADGFFGSGSFTKFDGVLAMYHDQGLIPFKTLIADEGVNYTAGLPIIRTSPAHGTAYELAGKNEANETSMRNAIYTAIDIYKNRNNLEELTSNPMKDYDISSI